MLDLNSSFVTPIRHADTPFAVAMRVDLAPRQMQQREIQQNALEAAILTDDTDPLIEWRAVDYQCSDGTTVKKLSVFNTGPGLDGDELCQVMNLAVSGGGKLNGLKENFGVGAKVTGLKNNPFGMRYRSCKDGAVSEVIIGKREGEYVILRQNCDGGYFEVTDVTGQCIEDGYDNAYDWTEVTLLGQNEKQDTVQNPYEPNGDIEQNWLVKSLNQRFWSFPEEVTIRLSSGILGKANKRRTRHITGFSGIRKYSTQEEEIDCGGGIQLRYCVLKNRSGGGDHYGLQPHICIVWRNECYNVISGFNWQRMAPRYGIPYGASRVAIQIHLDDNADVIPEQYRQFLQTDDGELQQIFCEDYSQLVLENRPEWFIEFVASQAPSTEEQSIYLTRRLKELMDDYKWMLKEFKPKNPHTSQKPGQKPGQNGTDQSGQSGCGGCGEENDGSTRNGTSSPKRREQFPEYRWIKGGTIKNRGEMSQRAARYDIKLHEIVLNEDYEIIERAVKSVVKQFPHVTTQHELRADVLRAVHEEFVFRSIKSVMMALAHKGDPHWSAASVDAALTEECLTVVLDDTRDIIKSVSPRLAQKYGASRK